MQLVVIHKQGKRQNNRVWYVCERAVTPTFPTLPIAHFLHLWGLPANKKRRPPGKTTLSSPGGQLKPWKTDRSAQGLGTSIRTGPGRRRRPCEHGPSTSTLSHATASSPQVGKLIRTLTVKPCRRRPKSLRKRPNKIAAYPPVTVNQTRRPIRFNVATPCLRAPISQRLELYP